MRAVRIAGLDEEAKDEARKLHLDDNQAALLKAAKAQTKDGQIKALREHAESRRRTRPHDDETADSDSPSGALNRLMGDALKNPKLASDGAEQERLIDRLKYWIVRVEHLSGGIDMLSPEMRELADQGKPLFDANRGPTPPPAPGG
jgi:hypothetical protein